MTTPPRVNRNRSPRNVLMRRTRRTNHRNNNLTPRALSFNNNNGVGRRLFNEVGNSNNFRNMPRRPNNNNSNREREREKLEIRRQREYEERVREVRERARELEKLHAKTPSKKNQNETRKRSRSFNNNNNNNFTPMS